MHILLVSMLALGLGAGLSLLAVESLRLPLVGHWGQRWQRWRQDQAGRLRALGSAQAESLVGWRPQALGALLGALAGWALNLSLLAPTGVLLGLLWPRLKEAQLREERARLLGEQMPGLFEALAAALRSGQSLNQALATAAEDLPRPAAALMQDASLRVGLGEVPEQALLAAGQVLDAGVEADWRMLCTTVAVVRSSGGKLPELLEQLAATVRERQRLQAQIRAQTAQARLSGWVIGCLPPALLLAMQAVDPELVAPLFQSATGWGILALAALLELAGLFLLRKMAEVRV